MKEPGLVTAIVGATGAVGEEMRKVLAERRFPVSRLVPSHLAAQQVKQSSGKAEALPLKYSMKTHLMG